MSNIDITKECINCHSNKPIIDFTNDKKTKDGLSTWCKICKKEYSRKYYANNCESFRKEKQLYRVIYKDKIKLQKRKYYLKNKEKISTEGQILRNHPIKGDLLREKVRSQRKHRRQIDPAYKIICNHRRRVNHALNGTSKSIETLKLLGCSNETWKLHLESLFKEGMTWENHGKYGWHIDHIIPIKSFNVTNLEEAKIAFNYTNTQPLWWYDNLSKGSTI